MDQRSASSVGCGGSQGWVSASSVAGLQARFDRTLPWFSRVARGRSVVQISCANGNPVSIRIELCFELGTALVPSSTVVSARELVRLVAEHLRSAFPCHGSAYLELEDDRLVAAGIDRVERF
jgi:hypothetical protein